MARRILVAPVAAGQGVEVVAQRGCPCSERPGVVRVKLVAPDSLRWDIAFIWRDGAYLSRAAQACLSCCVNDRLWVQCFNQVCNPRFGVFRVNCDAGIQTQHRQHFTHIAGMNSSRICSPPPQKVSP